MKDDLISRKDAIEAICIAKCGKWRGCNCLEIETLMKVVPSIQSEGKRGWWYFEEYPDGYYHSECDQCGRWFGEEAYMDHWNFCPNCGANMREET